MITWATVSDFDTELMTSFGGERERERKRERERERERGREREVERERERERERPTSNPMLISCRRASMDGGRSGFRTLLYIRALPLSTKNT